MHGPAHRGGGRARGRARGRAGRLPAKDGRRGLLDGLGWAGPGWAGLAKQLGVIYLHKVFSLCQSHARRCVFRGGLIMKRPRASILLQREREEKPF